MAKKENRHAELVSASVNIEAPYELPEGWKWCKLGDVAILKGGKRIPAGKKCISEKTPHVYIRVTDMQNDTVNLDNLMYITDDIYSAIENYTISKDDLYLTIAGTIGRVGIIPDCLDGMNLTENALKITDIKCDKKYLLYVLKSDFTQNYFFNSYHQVAMPKLSILNASNTKIPLPPTLAEQQRIVNRIESMFVKLDEAKEKAQNVVDSFETRKAAILHKVFTGELTAKWRKENGVADDSWEEKTLGEMTRILSSKRIFKEEYVETGVPFYRSTEIVELNDFGTTNPQIFITKERYKEIKEKYGVPEVGDLLVTSVGTIGKTWIVDDRPFYYKDGNLTQVKKCALLNMQFLDKFIKSSYFINQVFDTVAGTAYNALTIAKFSKIIIPVPTLPEQQEIVRILDTVLEKEFRAKEAAQTVLDQIALLKKSILARAFRGEL